MTARTPPQTSKQGNNSVYLCQVCSVEDDVEKVRCDGCTLWYHFKCSNVTNNVLNQDFWLCSSCTLKGSESDSEKATTATEHPSVIEIRDLVDIEHENPSGHSKQPHVTEKNLEKPPSAQAIRSTTTNSYKTTSATSSMKRKTKIGLQKLEEERKLLEQREIEAQERQRERDKEYLEQKYSILDLEDDAMSSISFDDEELAQEKFDSTRRWTQNIPPNKDPVLQLSAEVLLEAVRNRTIQPQDSTKADCQAVVNFVTSSSNQIKPDGSTRVVNDGVRISSSKQAITSEMQSQSSPLIGDPHVSQLYHCNGLPDWLTNPKSAVQPVLHPWDHVIQSQTSRISHQKPVSSQVHPVACASLPIPHTSISQPNDRAMANRINAPTLATVVPSNKMPNHCVNLESNSMSLHQLMGSNYQSVLRPTASTHQSITPANYHLAGLKQQFMLSSSTQQTSTSNAPQVQLVAPDYDVTRNCHSSGSIIQPMSSINSTYHLNVQPTITQTFQSNYQPKVPSNQVFWSSYSMPMTTTVSKVNTHSVTQQAVSQAQFNPPLVTNYGTASQQPFGSTFSYQHQPASINSTFIPLSQPTTVYYSMNDGMNQSYGNGSFGNIANSSIPSRLTAEQIAARHVMPRDLPQFDGDPNDWEAFISAFENSTETCGFSNSENLGRLQKCLKGDARTAVRSRLLHKDSVPGVLHTLRLMYGRPEFIIETMIRDIQKMPPPKDDDLSSLIKFAISVQNLSATIQNTGAFEHLRNPMLINSITDKLPAHLQLNWAFHRSSIGNVNIAHLGDWLYRLADVASQVVRLPSKSSHKKPEQNNNNSNSSKANPLLNTQVENISSTNNSKIEKNKSCPACNNNSCTRLASCKNFKDMSRTERWTVVKNSFLCGRCFGRHKFYRCSSDTKCTVDGCNANHHTLLHNYDTSSEATSNGGAKYNGAKSNREEEAYRDVKPSQVTPISAQDNNASGSDKKTCNSQRSKIAQRTDKFRIVPVMLHFKNKSVRDYAYLDDGSNMTTMEDSLAAELELTGSPKELCVDWAFGDKHAAINSRIVSVGISGYYENAPRFKMSNVRTVEHLHLPTQSITTSWINQYSHFKNIPIATYDSVRPRLLIGLQYSKLTVSLKTIEGRENEPMACKTRLGWVVQGPTFESDDASTKQTFSVNICECQHNDNDLHQLVKDYFAMENLGVKIPEKILESKELQRANKILESTTVKKNNRYESGLLWKYDDVKLPDSYDMALKRLTCLESKMAKNPELKANLSKQRNPKKPEKVRLVWDGAAKVKNTSLNSNLLVGPDQLVPLPEILRRFQYQKIFFKFKGFTQQDW